MRRYGFRPRRRRINWKQARFVVNRLTASKHVFRYHNIDNALSLPAGLTNTTLLASGDDPDYELGGNFTTACQCEEGAVITGIDLNLNFQHTVAGTAFEVILYKDTNGILSAAGISPSNLFSNSATANVQLLRKNCIAYKAFHIPTDKLERNLRVRVKKSALARIGQLKEDDALVMTTFNGHASTAGSLQGHGKIYVAEN